MAILEKVGIFGWKEKRRKLSEHLLCFTVALEELVRYGYGR